MKLKCAELLSNFALNCNLRHYMNESKQEYITFTVGQEGSPDITVGRCKLTPA